LPRGTALITGASFGIGAELAKLCAADGYDLILVARSTSRLEDLAGRLARDFAIAARPVTADLADPAAPDAIHSQIGSTALDILINNAGFGLRGAFAETSWDDESRLLQVNIGALAHLAKLLLPEMLRRRTGRILNVASTAAFVPGPFMAVYYASKAFVLSFSEALAEEVRGTGVSVTVLCPGHTDTQFAATAGVTDSGLFRGPVMQAADVAREGYRAMMAGKACVIAGSRNRWLMRGARLAPRGMLAGRTRRLNLAR